MKKASTKTADQDIPELKRDELGKGVRGKYLKQFTQGSNVVVLQPEIQKAFPTSGERQQAPSARQISLKPPQNKRKQLLNS